MMSKSGVMKVSVFFYSRSQELWKSSNYLFAERKFCFKCSRSEIVFSMFSAQIRIDSSFKVNAASLILLLLVIIVGY